MTAPDVTIIGAGIVGATIAYYLSRTGARVRLIEARTAPGRGVTGRSFGWVNYVTADPETSAEMYRHRRAAFDHYADLNRRLDGRLFDTPQGSLLWTSSARETERLVDLHAAQGSPTRIVDRAEFARLAPLVAAPPDRAAYSPNDVALNPDDASQLLIRSAKDAGLEVILGERVEAIQTTAGKAAAVRLTDDLLATDVIVVAAGTDSRDLLSPIAPGLGVAESAATLITIAAETEALKGVLKGPELEVRSRGENCLLVSSAPPRGPGEAGRDALTEQTLERLGRLLPGATNVRVRSVETGRRPTTRDGRPLVGRLAAVPNLLVAVAHPGVILAPAIGQTIAELIFDRPVSTALGADVIAP